ncbi:MAG TPA: ABC transporter ATP-binding protein [Marmoricola sp.]|jgi:branched-chain amino acid transport system ATP-binding protein|nr:ABC transporter ATP-binding protein [Marmoricola sp.]
MSRIAVDNVHRDFSGKAALSSVNLALEPGQVHAVIGPNGAGKSTLFSIIAGSMAPSSGTVSLGGVDITSWASHKRAKHGVLRAYQVARLFPSLTCQENVALALVAQSMHRLALLSPRGMTRAKQQAAEILEEYGMAQLGDLDAGALSQGDRKLLEIVMVVAQGPKVLLLDEPTAGMSPAETHATVELVRRVHESQGCAVLLTEHDMNVVFGLAGVVSVLVRGSVLCTGEPEEIRARDDVNAAYLGGG